MDLECEFLDTKHPRDLELYPRRRISQQFEFSTHYSHEKFELLIEWTAFNELSF